MTKYHPDKWMIVELKYKEHHFCKVMGSWFGGYLHGNSWRLNSGIEEVFYDGDSIHFVGTSGSCYTVHKDAYGAHMDAHGVLSNLEKQALEKGMTLIVYRNGPPADLTKLPGLKNNG